MKQNFDGPFNATAALNGARAGLVAAGGDPYTEYFTPSQAKLLQSDLSDSLSGIGAEIGIKDGALTIIAPLAGTPAAKAGLQPGDVIEYINNQNTTNMNVDNAVDLIRGPAGTKVTLKIDRAGLQEPLKLTITRANITVPSVTWSMKTSTIGYIDISQFTPNTASLMSQAATALKNKGAKGIILDLRDNPGGYLSAGVSVASQFLPAGDVVVSERVGGKTISTIDATSGGQLIGMPTVVLINDGSASASEIVSAALHDNHAAKLVGEQSFGKGSVQTIKDLPGGAELKVTIAHWYTPDGININKQGIAPDFVVPLTTANINAGTDPQLAKAESLLQ